MKKLKLIAAVFAAALAVFSGCKSDSDDGDGSGMQITVCVVNAPEDIGTCTFWSWEDGGGNYTKGKWDTDRAVMTKSTEDGVTIWSYTYEVNPNAGVGVVFVKQTTDSVRFPADGDDLIIPASEINDGAKLYISWGDKTVYKSVSECSGLQSAEVTSADGKTIKATIYNASSATKDDFSVVDKDEKSISIADVKITGSSAMITLGDGASVDKVPYSITFSGKTVTAMLATALIDELYDASNAAGLGLTLDGSNATFKAWAPLAAKVELVLYSDSDAKTAIRTEPMTREENGVWTYRGSYDSAKYYQYRIENPSATYTVADIWHTVAGPDSVASQIASIDDAAAQPEDWEAEYVNPWNGTDYTAAVIYEMHIRDWSRVESPSSTGKFLDIAKESGKVIEHLKDIGVTHVQILPMFDYAQKNADKKYNWGYNPYHYNVPEGRYVTEGYTDGTQAVKEMRQMIKALHDAGIAVNMDVVYNHTNGTGTGSLYDMTVPNYFYRQDDSGNNTNGSGCGNEVATQRKMVKKYVIDSLKHWMNDYHINGFRFDLMDLHEKETMKEIYEELSAIDPNVMVYGEPWTGNGKYPTDGCNSAVAVSGAEGSNGVGAFDDDFRDAIKGAEYNGFQKGQVQGTNKDSGITAGLVGTSGSNKRNETGKPGLALHYVECHDNYTLFDKLAISYLNKTSGSGDLFTQIGTAGLAEVKKQDMLAAAYVFLSQGTPFINGGQEFLRTKKGDENSYQSDDSINQINIGFKTTYSDVYNTYKGLIALRKANPAAFGANKDAKAETVKTGVTKYTTGDFLVYFNASDDAVTISADGYTKTVDVSSGAPTDAAVPTSVPAKSFVILKK